jgi:hypothetical protein
LVTMRTAADDIQRQMAEIRSQLHQEIREVVSDATSAADWRSYIRARPWLAIGFAFTSGFLLVPRRVRTPAPLALPAPVAERILQAAVPEEPHTKRSRGSPVWWLLNAVGPIALRAAQSYAMNSIENLLANQQSGPRPEAAYKADTPGPTARPDERRWARG